MSDQNASREMTALELVEKAETFEVIDGAITIPALWPRLIMERAIRAATPASPEPVVTEYGSCGSLGWTVTKWGRVTHKHSCPNRIKPWCQTHPDGCDTVNGAAFIPGRKPDGGAGTLDEAWAAAEAALPAGGGKTQDEWRLDELGQGPTDGWCAVAVRSCVPVWSSERSEWERVVGLGPTPVAALRALATRLAEAGGPSR